MKKNIVLFVFLMLGLPASAQTSIAPLLEYIQNRSDIREGGCAFFNYKEKDMIIAVSTVAVGSKSEMECKKIGGVKAKKEILAFVNGSEITSVTSLETSETVEETLTGRKVESKQVYSETIREKVLGEINKITPLGGWYSEDHTVYYYAIYKFIE